MSRPPDIKRIRAEDFPEEMQDTISRLAYSINTFMDQVVFLFNNNIDYRNLAQEIIDITFVTDGSGNIENAPRLVQLNNINRKTQGILCIQAQDLNDPTNTPSSQPFVTFTLNANQVRITNVTGLTANTEWRLRLLFIGRDA